MKKRSPQNMPRVFESLEPRYALDGETVSPWIEPLLPPTICPPPGLVQPLTIGVTIPPLAVRVYTAPIGPVPATVKPAAVTTTQTGSTLPTIPSGAFSRLGSSAALPIGPARPASLSAPAQPLYASGVLPTSPSTSTTPTERQSMPIITDPPGPPKFTPLTGLRLY